MKTNEEFIEGIYSKKDALIKKRKKKISVIATTVCAVVCIVAAVGVFNSDKPNIVIELYNDIRKSGSALNHSQPDSIEKEYVGNAEGEVSTSAPDVEEYLTSAEIFTKPTRPAEENATDDKIQQEGFVGKSEVLTDVAEGNADGEVGFAPEIPDSASNMSSPTMPLPSKKPMPSSGEIIEAAYESLPEEDRQSVAKDYAVATVTRYADGTQIFEVTFAVASSLQTSDVHHITVQLDSDLNKILVLNF